MNEKTDMSNYTKVTNYSDDPNYEAHTETIVWRNGERTTSTYYLPKGQQSGSVAIPPRALVLDPAKIAEAQAQADYILHTIFGK